MTLFSIGYATKSIGTLFKQLQEQEVSAVADIRSVPYSRAFPDYHREALQTALLDEGIQYVYLGEELGPRSKEDAHYDDTGQVQFDRLMQSRLFQQGIARLKAGMEKGLNIALLCAEKDPAICHRSLLVAHYLLVEEDIDVQHITHEGTLESQADLEQRLIQLQGLQADLLTPAEDLASLAYQGQVQDRAYRKPA